VCLCVCLSVRDHIFGTTRPIFTIFVHVTNGRGSVLGWRRNDTLCISGFLDDVIFARNLRLLDVAAMRCSENHTQPRLVAQEYPLQAADARDDFLTYA